MSEPPPSWFLVISVLDLDEPRRLGVAVKALALDHIVITSVNRDDLSDGGAFAQCIEARRHNRKM